MGFPLSFLVEAGGRVGFSLDQWLVRGLIKRVRVGEFPHVVEADAVRLTVLLGHEHVLHAWPDTILIDGAKKRGHSDIMALILVSGIDRASTTPSVIILSRVVARFHRRDPD